MAMAAGLGLACTPAHDPTPAAGTTGTSGSSDAGTTGPSTGSSGSSGSTSGAQPGSSTGPEGSSGSTGSPPASPAIGPTMGAITLPFRVALGGSGSGLIGAFDVTDDVGTIEVAGKTLPLLVYERQPWPSQGYTLYQGLAVADDAWVVVWFYCTDAGAESIYVESTDGIALQTLMIDGTCDVLVEDAEVTVDLPGTEFTVVYEGIPSPSMGPEVSVTAGALGHLELGGVDHVVAPFETVDCSTACGTPGWYEVHALLWDPLAHRATFAILYLEMDGSVTMAYGLTLPDLVEGASDATLEAAWTFG